MTKEEMKKRDTAIAFLITVSTSWLAMKEFSEDVKYNTDLPCQDDFREAAELCIEFEDKVRVILSRVAKSLDFMCVDDDCEEETDAVSP